METNTKRRNSSNSVVVRRIAAVLLASVVTMGVVMAKQGAFKNANTPQWSGLLAVLAFIAVVAVIAVLSSQGKKKTQRVENTHILADKFGLTYHKGNVGDVKKRFHRLPEIKKSGKIKKVIQGSLAGREFVGFEHVHMIYTGNATVPVQRTVYAVATPHWPRVTIRANRRLGAFVRKLVGRTDLQLDLPEFNKRCRVTADNEDFAFLLLTQDLQQHILDKPTVVWRLLDGWVCLVYNGPMKLGRTPTSLRRLERFVELIPPELNDWTDPEQT